MTLKVQATMSSPVNGSSGEPYRGHMWGGQGKQADANDTGSILEYHCWDM
jgi:hypothetical protein